MTIKIKGFVMKFEFENFVCDVDFFLCDNDIAVRFYDKSHEQNEDQIHDLVIVNPGYGYLVFKQKGDDGLLSGFLDETVFKSDEIVEAAVDFLEGLANFKGYIPYHVDRFKPTSYVEYNGEY